MGGFASTYDLIASEYGWTDKQIGKLTLARVHQITAAIRLRKMADDRERRGELAWAVKNISSFIVGGYQTEGDTSEIQDMVSKLTIDDIEQEIIKADLPEAPAEPKVGSTERLMQAFAGRG